MVELPCPVVVGTPLSCVGAAATLKERGNTMKLTMSFGKVRKTIKWPDAPKKPSVAVTFGGQKA